MLPRLSDIPHLVIDILLCRAWLHHALLAKQSLLQLPLVARQWFRPCLSANPKCGSLMLTSGMRMLLTKDQLAALIGHELAHIRSRDTLAATIGTVFLEAILMFALLRGDHRASYCLAMVRRPPPNKGKTK